MKHLIARHRRGLALAITCVAVGVGIGAITSAGATTTTTAASSAKAGSAVVVPARHGRLRRRGALLRRAVQGDVVVRTASGFGTVSFQRGTVESISGTQLTLTEGTRKASYRSVTVTLPAQAVVRDDGKQASLSSVTPGQRVVVIHAPRRTFVLAHTPVHS
jgi:hypothetical protein